MKKRLIKVKRFAKAKNNNSDDYDEKCMKVRINADDDLPIESILPMHKVVIVSSKLVFNNEN